MFPKFIDKHLSMSLFLNIINKNCGTEVFLWILENFENISFTEHLRAIASEALIS